MTDCIDAYPIHIIPDGLYKNKIHERSVQIKRCRVRLRYIKTGTFFSVMPYSLHEFAIKDLIANLLYVCRERKINSTLIRINSQPNRKNFYFPPSAAADGDNTRVDQCVLGQPLEGDHLHLFTHQLIYGRL